MDTCVSPSMGLSLNDGFFLSGAAMTVTVSSKYQVVIPQDIRQSVGIRPGQKVEVVQYGGHIALVPVPTPEAMRGSLKGAHLDGFRDKTDRA